MSGVTASQATRPPTHGLWNNSLDAWLSAWTQLVGAGAVAVPIGEVIGIAPNAVAEGWDKERASRPEHVQTRIHDRLRAAFHIPERTERTVHHDRVALPQAQRFQVSADPCTSDHCYALG